MKRNLLYCICGIVVVLLFLVIQDKWKISGVYAFQETEAENRLNEYEIWLMDIDSKK